MLTRPNKKTWVILNAVIANLVITLHANAQITPVIKWTFDMESAAYGVAAAADITNDAYLDIIYATSAGVLTAIDGFSHTKLFDLDLRSEFGDPRFELDHAPLVADFDGDGNLDIFITGGYGVIPMDENFGRAYLIGIGPGNGPEWLMFQRDPWRRNNICDIQSSTITLLPTVSATLYPNPAQDQVTIQINRPAPLSEVILLLHNPYGQSLVVPSEEYSVNNVGSHG